MAYFETCSWYRSPEQLEKLTPERALAFWKKHRRTLQRMQECSSGCCSAWDAYDADSIAVKEANAARDYENAIKRVMAKKEHVVRKNKRKENTAKRRKTK